MTAAVASATAIAPTTGRRLLPAALAAASVAAAQPAAGQTTEARTTEARTATVETLALQSPASESDAAQTGQRRPAAVEPLSGLPSTVGSPAAARLDEPLPPGQAFPWIAFAEAGSVVLSFQLPAGYYLYRHRFGFGSLTDGVALGEPELPEGRPHLDEFFGDVKIHRGDFQIRIPYRSAGAAREMLLRLELQGCADIGYCYLPVSRERRVRLAGGE